MRAKSAQITVRAPNDMFVLRLIDNRLREITMANGRELHKTVPPGYYVARCELGGPALEKGIRVESGDSIEIAFERHGTSLQIKRRGEELLRTFEPGLMPEFASAAPVSGAANNHEYYELHQRELAARAYADQRWKGGGHRLIVMNRRLEPDSKRRVSLRGFKLLDATGALVSDFQRKKGDSIRKREDIEFGRFAHSVDLPAGGYLLVWPSAHGRRGSRTCLPVWIPDSGALREVVCSVYLGIRGEEKFADPAGVSIHLASLWRSKCRDSESDRTSQSITQLSGTATEFALASLRTGRRQLTDLMLEHLLHEKFENPLSGILGAYMLCQRDEINSSLLNEVLRNLRQLVGDHPDLKALTILAIARGLTLDAWTKHDRSPGTPLSFPPMILSGAHALKTAESMIAPDSLAALAVLDSSGAGPWNVFNIPAAMVPARARKRAVKIPMETLDMSTHLGGLKKQKAVKKNIGSKKSAKKVAFKKGGGMKAGGAAGGSGKSSFSLSIRKSSASGRGKRNLLMFMRPVEGIKAGSSLSFSDLVKGQIANLEDESSQALIQQREAWARRRRGQSSRMSNPEAEKNAMEETAHTQLRAAGFTEVSAERIIGSALRMWD